MGDTPEELVRRTREAVGGWIDSYVKAPIFETIEQGLFEQTRVANVLACCEVFERLVREEGSDIDFEYLKSLPEREVRRRLQVLQEYAEREGESEDELMMDVSRALEDGSTRKYLLLYFHSETHWIAASIMATAYISSLILTRSLFELVIGIATRKTGTMGAKLDAIGFLDLEEKRAVKRTYGELCSWSHPYGKWLREVCPIFASRPAYHPELFRSCVEKLEAVTDLMLVVAVDKFEVDRVQLVSEMNKESVDLSRFSSLAKRV